MKQNPSISERFRSQSNRLEWYDYSQSGAYFVTICVKERACIFWEIENGEMVLNECGNIVKNIIEWMLSNFDSIQIDSYVIMPNHLHLIIVICRDAINRVSTSEEWFNNRVSTLDWWGWFSKSKNPMLSISLWTIIRWIKWKSTFEIRKIFPEFSWQSNYHDHIIRDETELQKIREYIFYNPANWQTDEENIS